MKKCPKCGLNHEKLGKFCSRKCANSRVWSKEINEKRSKSVKEYADKKWNGYVSPREFCKKHHEYKCDLCSRNRVKRPYLCKKHASKSCNLCRKISVSNEEMFVRNGKVVRHAVKDRIIKQHLIPYECQICGIGPIWNNKPMVLILDHINGVKNDDRLENLRFTCANCGTQLETYCAKNKRRMKLKFIDK